MREKFPDLSSFVASFAVLLFEPHTTMPPSNNETAAAKSPRSDRITPTSIAARTTSPTSYGDPGGQDEFATALNLGSKLFDVLLKTDDLFVRFTIFYVFFIGHSYAASSVPVDSPCAFFTLHCELDTSSAWLLTTIRRASFTGHPSVSVASALPREIRERINVRGRRESGSRSAI